MNSKISLAVVLGSGLGEYASLYPKLELISEDKEGVHKKTAFISEIDKKPIMFFSGRKHFYEGYTIDEITAGMNTAASYGVSNIIITNAAGGLNENFGISDLMLIDSHLNLNQKLVMESSHFPYSEELGAMIENVCEKESIKLHKGIYCCSSGPAYETKAEIRMLKQFGVDAVGMSTVPESFKANELGIRVAAISVITNLLNENNLTPPSHDDVIVAAAGASDCLFSLIKRLLLELN